VPVPFRGQAAERRRQWVPTRSVGTRDRFTVRPLLPRSHAPRGNAVPRRSASSLLRELLKVAFLNPWDRRIGPNRYLAELLRAAPEVAAEALVALPPGSDAGEEYRELGCRVEHWPEVALVHPRAAPADLARLAGRHTVGLVRVAARFQQFAPRLVMTNSESVWVGGLAARLLGLPHLQAVHALTFVDRLGDRPVLLAAYLGALASWSRRLVAVSRTVARALEAGGVSAGQIALVPNPIPVARLGDRAGPAAADGGLDAELEGALANRRPLLVAAGRLSAMKGQDLLVEALPAIRRLHPSLLCVLAGRQGSAAGAEDTDAFVRRLHARIAALGLGGAIHFAGERVDLPALLRRADVYVQPSRTESFGRVVAEALVAGTPVVAFAVGGVPEAAGPGALLAPAEDTMALAEAVLATLADPQAARRRTAAGGEYVAREFDVTHIAPRFSALLRETVAAG
jgi:glycosyltransferase involved in cell wall biosynthesis